MSQLERGIALIQILIITAILSVFALYLTQTAKQQVNMSMMAQDKAASELAIHSAESEILFHLLTKDKIKTYESSDVNTIESYWNFYNTPFAINQNVEVTIQDQASLLNLHSIHRGRAKRLFQRFGITEQRTEEILDRLFDWQDADSITRPLGQEANAVNTFVRNGPVPDITEVRHILELSDVEVNIFREFFTIFFFGDFNLIYSAIPLVEALSSKEAAAHLALLRNNQHVSKSEFLKITGMSEEDDMSFKVSSVLKVVFKATVNSAQVEREIVVSLSPYSKESYGPINMLSDRKK